MLVNGGRPFRVKFDTVNQSGTLRSLASEALNSAVPNVPLDLLLRYFTSPLGAWLYGIGGSE